MLKRRPGFSFLDMMMYVALVALALHYAAPSYRLLISKIRAQEVIHDVQQAQVEIYEQILLSGQLPDDYALQEYHSEWIDEWEWDGHSLVIHVLESPNSETSELILTPVLESYAIKWSCEYHGAPALRTYLCYVLT